MLFGVLVYFRYVHLFGVSDLNLAFAALGAGIAIGWRLVRTIDSIVKDGYLLLSTLLVAYFADDPATLFTLLTVVFTTNLSINAADFVYRRW